MKAKKIIFTILILISVNIKLFSQTNHLRNSLSLEFFNSIMTTVAAPLVVNNAMYFLLDNLKINNFSYTFKEDIAIKFDIPIKSLITGNLPIIPLGIPENIPIDTNFKINETIEMDVKELVIRPAIEKNIFYGRGSAKINYCFDISKKIVLNFDTGILVWNAGFDRTFGTNKSVNINYKYDYDNVSVKANINGEGKGEGIFKVNFNYNANFYVIPIALGIRFYVNENEYAHGFFIMPKFGTTITILDEKFLFNIYSGGSINVTNTGTITVATIPTPSFTTNIINVTLGTNNSYTDGNISKQVGVYASLEVGFRARLFPSKYSVWRVRPFLDISFFEVGYYLNSYVNQGWGLRQLGKLMNTEFFEEYGWLLNVKILPMPRIAIGIIF